MRPFNQRAQLVVHALENSMSSLSKPISLLLLVVWLVIPSSFGTYISRSYYQSDRCNTSCGAVDIPFPFGIGSDCAFNEWFSIDCNKTSAFQQPVPFLSKLKYEVSSISLLKQTVTISSQVNSYCGDNDSSVSWNPSNLTGSPFYYSKNYNRLFLLGCGNVLLQQNQSSVLSGCMSTCHKSVREIDINGCYGIRCCETSIPLHLSEYKLNFTPSDPKRPGDCISAFLADQSWSPSSYSDARDISGLIPLVLTWTIQNSNLSNYCNTRNSSIQVDSGNSINTWSCICWSFPDICDRIVEPPVRKIRTPFIVVITSVGVLFLVAASFMSYKLIKRRKARQIKEKFFKQNGGLLLQKQISTGDNVIEKTTVFTAVELEKATDNFNENRILGRGGQGTVYKGMLTDGRIVAVKRSKLADESQVEQFINEVVVLSQVIHKNVVKLLGCCLETEVPLLVYEFIPNGTLFDLIHNETDREFFTWNVRLRIAAEAAGALAYLHSAVSIPIYHRDIKSTNILLDERYTAKVSDFGTSKTVEIDKTHVTTLVRGTFGYLDPEYFQSSQFTEKSDVYSFGVVLIELLTGQKAISRAGASHEDGSNLSLATRFLVSMEESCLEKIVDAQVSYHDHREDINAVAMLAERCLNLNGKKRPTMREVAFELERIKVSKVHPSITSNVFRSLECIEEESTLEFTDSIPTCSSISSSTSRSTSDTSPLLFNTV